MKPMRWIVENARAVYRILSRINAVVALVCGVLVFCYMFLVIANVTGRYAFASPVDGTMEIGQLVLASVIFFSLAYAQMKRSHIRVRAVLEHLPLKWQEILEIATLAVGFLVMILLAWRALPFALESYNLKEVHVAVDVPIWPTKFIFFIGWTLFGIQFFVELINRVLAKLGLGSFESLQKEG
jgi:TRAP-type C4-dicarboxylate transport system permease small subunit